MHNNNHDVGANKRNAKQVMVAVFDNDKYTKTIAHRYYYISKNNYILGFFHCSLVVFIHVLYFLK